MILPADITRCASESCPDGASCLRCLGEWTGYGRCSQLLAMGWSDCDGCPGAHSFLPGGDASG